MLNERRFHSFEISLLISAIIHGGLVLLLSRHHPLEKEGWDLQEVSFLDVTYRPEVAKIVGQNPAPAEGGGGNFENTAVPTYATGVSSEEVAPLDMGATLDRSASQARIELDRYELARGGEMNVIKIGGKGSAKSTEEILAQAPIPLSRGSGRASGAGMGLRGIPGVPQEQSQPQLTIERRLLSKPGMTKLPESPPQTQTPIQVSVSSGTSFQIAGPISQREIIKKVKPKYPRWALDQHISGKVTVRIWVLPNGQVKGMPQVISSSGYPELDQVVVEAVRCWEFAPLGTGVKAEEQWGDITFIFQLA